MVRKAAGEYSKTKEEQLGQAVKAAFDWFSTCYGAITKNRVIIMKNKELVAIAETFADYEFKNGEKGLYYRCLGRTGRIVFAKGYATYCLKQGWMYRQKMEYIAIEEHIPNKGDKKTFKK